jgi:hypothetical protein
VFALALGGCSQSVMMTGGTSSGGTTAVNMTETGGVTGTGGAQAGTGGRGSSGENTGSGGAAVIAASGGATGGITQTDAGMDAGTPSFTDAGATSGCVGLFCEDFEKGTLDPAIWDVKVNGGQQMPTVVTQAGLVAHGKYAAHFHANPSVVSYNFIITKNPPAALRGHHFGRAYFMITPMPPTNHTEYVYAGTTGFPQTQYLEVASAAPLVWQLTYVKLVQPDTGEDYHSGGKVPIARWFCLEWEFNDAPDQATVYVDGTQSFSQKSFIFGGATTGLVGGFAAFGFGYYVWHPATYAFDIYYDDIVLDTKRIGCLD